MNATQQPDPYLAAAFPLGNRALRFLWSIVYVLLFRTTPRPMHAWRSFLLRRFGARIGANVHVYPTARIWAPWNLVCMDNAAIAEDAIVYNPEQITLGSHAIVSQQAYLCGATHDQDDPAFPLMASPIEIGSYAWVCARAAVMPGIRLAEGAVLGFNAVATKNLEPWTVYAGIPARKVKDRKRAAETSQAARQGGSGR